MISAIVLAAGKSTRMGKENKMLLPFKGATVLGTVLKHLTQSMADDIIVVTGSTELSAGIVPELTSRINVVKNNDFATGLTSSIQCGVKHTSPKTTGFMFCLGDMPLLNKDDYNILINKFLDVNNQVILLPSFKQKRGNPVIFSHHFLEQILQNKSSNGNRSIIRSFPSYVVEVPVENKRFFSDIDTAEDYRKLAN